MGNTTSSTSTITGTEPTAAAVAPTTTSNPLPDKRKNRFAVGLRLRAIPNKNSKTNASPSSSSKSKSPKSTGFTLRTIFEKSQQEFDVEDSSFNYGLYCAWLQLAVNTIANTEANTEASSCRAAACRQDSGCPDITDITANDSTSITDQERKYQLFWGLISGLKYYLSDERNYSKEIVGILKRYGNKVSTQMFESFQKAHPEIPLDKGEFNEMVFDFKRLNKDIEDIVDRVFVGDGTPFSPTHLDNIATLNPFQLDTLHALLNKIQERPGQEHKLEFFFVLKELTGFFLAEKSEDLLKKLADEGIVVDDSSVSDEDHWWQKMYENTGLGEYITGIGEKENVDGVITSTDKKSTSPMKKMVKKTVAKKTVVKKTGMKKVVVKVSKKAAVAAKKVTPVKKTTSTKAMKVTKKSVKATLSKSKSSSKSCSKTVQKSAKSAMKKFDFKSWKTQLAAAAKKQKTGNKFKRVYKSKILKYKKK